MQICVHSGAFHADEVLAAAIVTFLHGGTVVRSRDSKVWSQSDILIDVGGEYDPILRKFDHHQKDFNEKRDNGVPYAAAGLVWAHFGLDYIAKVSPDLTEVPRHWVFEEVDRRFIQKADSVDVGISIPGEPDFSFTGIISNFNSTWLAEPADEADETRRFSEALNFGSAVLLNLVRNVVAEAKSLAVTQAAERIEDEQIIVLTKQRVPYDSYVVPNLPMIKLAVYPSARNGEWAVRVVPKKMGSFEARLDLPKSWAGLRDKELAAVTGVADSIFCHNGRFICAARSKQGAIALAKLALAHDDRP